MGAENQAKGRSGRRQRGQAPRKVPPNAGRASAASHPPPGCKGRSTLHKKTKNLPLPAGKGGGGWGRQSKLKAGAAGDKEGKPPLGTAPARRAGEAGAIPPAGHEICFLLRRLKINPVAVAFFEKPLAFLRKIWYNTIQSCTVACSCARKPARV